jgi:hypothetical protein
MRYGQPGGDDTMPDPETATKWRYLPHSKLWLKRDTRKLFRREDAEAHAKEIEEDFTKNIVLAWPRRLSDEPEVWKGLTELHTQPEEVCRICKQSRYLGRHYLNVVLSNAKTICDSRRDPRYPRAGLVKGSKPRPSSEDRRADYLARVMAGLSLRKPLAPATAVDLLRKIKHPRSCVCWHCCLRVAR